MKSQNARYATGGTIIAAGAILLLANLQVADFDYVVREWWPLALIAAGLLMIINDVKNYIWAGIVIALGVVLQIRELDMIDVNPWQLLWPAIIIAVGASILFRRNLGRSVRSDENEGTVTAILGGSDIRSTSSDFKGSNVTAALGGVKIDLSKATIKKEATIDVFVLMGGVELVVPRGVIVRNMTSSILGGVEDRAEQSEAKGAPILNIRGDVILGGIEIKN